MPPFLNRLPNFPSKGFFYFLCCCCFDGNHCQYLRQKYPIHLIKALTTFHIWVHFLFKAVQLFFSVAKKKYTIYIYIYFLSIMQLSYILNSTSTECSSLSYSHLPSAKYTTKITLLFILYNLNRIILLLYNQEFLQI